MAKAKAREQASATRALASGWAEAVSQLLHNLAVQAVSAPPGLTPGVCSVTGRARGSVCQLGNQDLVGPSHGLFTYLGMVQGAVHALGTPALRSQQSRMSLSGFFRHRCQQPSVEAP